MTKQVVVVSRKLNGAAGWVTSVVKIVPENIDFVESFANKILIDEKNRLSSQFVEFAAAEFKAEVVPLNE